MTKLPLSLAVGATFLAAALTACRAAEPEPGQIAVSEAKALEQLHYTRHSLDDSISDKLLHTYIETFDFNRLFFTQGDINDFEKKYDHELDDAIWLGDLKPAQVIYDAYIKRVEARIAKVKTLLATEKFDFDGHDTIEVNRLKAPWPKDEADADRLWHDRIENELLTERLAETPVEKKPVKAPDTQANVPPAPDDSKVTDPADAKTPDKPKDTPEQVVAKRYDRLLRSLHEQTKDDVNKFFLNALAQCYDPHSEYMSPSEMENFSINMRLSLTGIGAILRKEDEYSKIVELVVGGPAAVEGELKVDDKIAAVAQGNEPFVDVVDMKLDKVVEMIRGKKGSIVRLQVIPAGTTDNSKRKIINITRDEVKLTDQEARAEIIEHKRDDGTIDKLGWITLPGFYADMDGSHAAGSKRKSTTKDVAALLTRLNKEGITGLVMDIRRNGGGSLEEAINLTGLFIKKGPVVQAKDYNKQITVSSDKDPSILYSGPMVVLTSHISASASEIFAGALQDYQRAVIVGDKSTFGKGTVQTLLELGRFMSPFGFKVADAGALKLTIQKFYRPSGQSTQLKGVESDVVLPSRYAHLEVGEEALKYPLPFDEVKPADYEKWPGPWFDLGDLRTKSATRVKADPEFRYLQQDIDKMDARIKSNTLSLNEGERRAERDADKKRAEDIKAERLARHIVQPPTYALALSDVDKPKLSLVPVKKDKDKPAAAKADAADATGEDPVADELDDDAGTAKAEAIDPAKTESLNILEDMIEQSHGRKIAAKTQG